ncbi:MAG: type II toxin-antitoxin system VapB family antitoxin [Burkholderiaceae bacterium]|jgi:hypothetical protein|nr:type II toxin-antitoxin system VapB family antitoxin [Burkholderiaceae bacterium]
MKTTIELPDALFAQARRYASARSMTMKALVEQGLRKVMAEKKDAPKFKLRDGSFKGNGLTPEFQNATWEQFRDAIYEGHGA